MGLGLGVLAAMMGGPKAALPLVEIALASRQAESALRADYQVDLARESDPVVGSGVVNGQSFSERANLVDGKLQWRTEDSSAGANLVIEVGGDERSLAITGQLSGVNADLRLAPFTDAHGNIAGIETTGVLNGEQYFMKSTVDIQGMLFGRAKQTQMHVVGLVQGESVEKSYQVGIERVWDGLHLRARGNGLNAGLEQDVAVDVHVRDR